MDGSCRAQYDEIVLQAISHYDSGLDYADHPLHEVRSAQ